LQLIANAQNVKRRVEMPTKNKSRLQLEELIEAGDLPGLLKKAGELHGHHCNYLAYGVVAGLYGVRKLGVSNTGMEEVIAVVETNNCFSDGVQMVTGCSFGNNALIYRDYGKTAVTISKRDGKAIRLALNPDFEDSREKQYPEAHELFNKLVVRREGGKPDDYARLMTLFAEMSRKELNTPVEKMFLIEEKEIEIPPFAPIFESVKCAKCGENVMKSRAIERHGQHHCIPCAKEAYFEMNGSGILERK
jgi:formylmethanofuran dehydrogenase subunit E